MAWHELMNQAVEYIESKLSSEIDMDRIAEISGQSAASFLRTFSIITDISLSEYIRRRRMTLAAFDIQNSDEKIIDISMKYNYESPEAFTRAFKGIHGVSPSQARNKDIPLITFPRITFLLTIKGDVAMNYKIAKKEAFTVYGIEEIFSTQDDCNIAIPEFWMDCINDKSLNKLIESTGNAYSDVAVNAVCSYRKTRKNTFPYMLFVDKTSNSNTDGYTELVIPAATWAIFKTERHPQSNSDKEIQALVKRVYTDWLPTASYEKIEGYELEMYYNSEDGTCYCETWIRVVAK